MTQLPTLYSLFETKESIEKLGAHTKLSQQRYLVAWNFSTLLCSIEHPGRAPCFFPSDFCTTSGRRQVQSITTLVGHCPAVQFHEEYHLKSAALCSGDFSGPEVSIEKVYDTSKLKEKKNESVPFSVKGKSEVHSIVEVESKVQPCGRPPQIFPNTDQENFEHSSKRISGFFPNPDRSKHFDLNSPKIQNDHFRRFHETKVSPRLLNEDKRSSVLKNFDNFKRQIMRKCMGDSANILIVKDYWKKAEDTFLTRLSDEIRELERLIQDYIER